MGLDGSSATKNKRMDTIEEQKGVTTRVGLATTPLEMLGLVRKRKRFILEELRAEYGDYAASLIDRNNLANIFQVSEASRHRFHRRILEKILTRQLQPSLTVSIKWVSAGDASAAGYGNMPEDSYTTIMERTVQEAFATVGLEFVAVNLGIDGFGSGLEGALCMDSLYGLDVDFLSWDFASTDGSQSYRAALWGVRAERHPNHPLLVMLDSNDSSRWGRLNRMDGRVGIALMDQLALQSFRLKYLPDSARFTNPEQLPPALQYYQCNGAPEGIVDCNNDASHFICVDGKGEQCQRHKFRPNLPCKYQEYHSPWIKGWKEHRLRGRLLGLFLFQLLQDALLELDATIKDLNTPVHQSAHHMIDLYRQKKFQDEILTENSPISPEILGQHAEVMSDLVSPLFERPARCQLPDTIFDRHIHENKKQRNLQDNTTSIVTINGGDCPFVGFGHREAFQVVKNSQAEGFRLDVVPQDPAGSFLIACFRTCTVAGCYKVMDGLDSVKIANGNILIEVDGAKVTGSREMDSCHFLEGVHGLHWATEKKGYFSIKFHAKEEGGSLLLFSVISMQISAEFSFSERRRHHQVPK